MSTNTRLPKQQGRLFFYVLGRRQLILRDALDVLLGGR
jgi:hypothetical protein